MDRADLAQLEHENLIATLELVASNAEAAVVRRTEGVALRSGGPDPMDVLVSNVPVNGGYSCS